jgi:hypothetical protein
VHGLYATIIRRRQVDGRARVVADGIQDGILDALFLMLIWLSVVETYLKGESERELKSLGFTTGICMSANIYTILSFSLDQNFYQDSVVTVYH